MVSSRQTITNTTTNYGEPFAISTNIVAMNGVVPPSTITFNSREAAIELNR